MTHDPQPVTLDYTRIAGQIHEFYRQQSRDQGWKNDFDMTFAELPEFMKVDNIAAARRISHVLSHAGLQLVPRDEVAWPETEQQRIRDRIEQNIELLAEAEHEGWVAARLREGWRPGKCKSPELRESHLLVPWTQLRKQIELKQEHLRQHGNPPSMTVEVEYQRELEKDRASVRNYVQIIALTTYRIIKERALESDPPTSSGTQPNTATV